MMVMIDNLSKFSHTDAVIPFKIRSPPLLGEMYDINASTFFFGTDRSTYS